MSPDPNLQLTAVTLCTKNVVGGSGTATFAGVDIQDFIGTCKLIFSTVNTSNTDGGVTLTCNLLDSADNTTFTTLTTPTIAAVTATSSLQTIALDTRVVRRYVQFKHLTTSTGTFATSVILVGQKQVV